MIFHAADMLPFNNIHYTALPALPKVETPKYRSLPPLLVYLFPMIVNVYLYMYLEEGRIGELTL
jgi:hypothetical protein